MMYFVLGAVFGKRENLLTIAAGIFLLPGMNVEVSPQAGKTNVGPSADNTDVIDFSIHYELIVIIVLYL